MGPQEFHALLPLLILSVGSVILLLLGAYSGLSPKVFNIIGAAVSLAAGIVSVFYHPAGVVIGGLLQMDGIGRIFVAAVSFAASVTLLLSIGYAGRRPLGSEEYPSLVLFAAFGMAFLAASVSLLGVFIGLESMSLALYILLASNKSDPLSGEAGLKYLIIGAISTAFFAYGLALIYVDTGTLSIAEAMKTVTVSGRVDAIGLAGWAMLIVGFGFKASLFPFHFWAPDVYEGGPAPVVAFLSTGSKATVFAAFLRFATASHAGWGSLVPVLWVIAALTMGFGNIAALTQNNIKRLLAYSSIAQMGYVLLALIAAPKTGPTAAIFYLLVYIAMDIGAFGVVAAFSGKDKDLGDIEDIKGFGFIYPFRSAALSVCLISLAGLPPTAGFIGKFGIFYAALKAGYVYLAIIGILTAIISIYYYLRVVVYLYMRKEDIPAGAKEMPAVDTASRIALAAACGAVIILGVAPGGILDVITALLARSF
ncbi:MAG: NADH-quinone oxidoreductase subunit N [Nitrospirota bacterium]